MEPSYFLASSFSEVCDAGPSALGWARSTLYIALLMIAQYFLECAIESYLLAMGMPVLSLLICGLEIGIMPPPPEKTLEEDQ